MGSSSSRSAVDGGTLLTLAALLLRLTRRVR